MAQKEESEARRTFESARQTYADMKELMTEEIVRLRELWIRYWCSYLTRCEIIVPSFHL